MNTVRTCGLALLCALLVGGCVINSDKYRRPRDLAPDWLVDRTRLLGIRAEPAEARPGDVVTFEALIGQAWGDDTELAVIWLACPVDDEGNGFGCVTDFGSIDVATADPADLASLGFIGFEPGLPPVYTVPDDLLDGLEPDQRAEGRYVLVQTVALPLDLVDEQTEELDFALVDSGYKRLVVSEAETPNHNPGLGVFTVDGFPVPQGAVVTLDPGQTYELGVLLLDDARETYVYVNSSGGTEDRVEEPYATWFTTGGDMTEEVTLWPYLEATWVAPSDEADGEEPLEDPSGRWYAVFRDRRGGMSWLVQDWTTVQP